MMRNENEPFFVIWNPDHGTPTTRHHGYDMAEREARRLAAANPGARFFILQARSLVRIADPVTVTELVFGDHDDGVPF